MNFSNTTKFRKILSLILVMVMMATLFAGCKKEEAPSPTDAPNAGPNIVEPSPSEEATSPVVTEPVEINENMATVLSQINIRSAPTTESVVVGNLFAGDKVEVSRREDVAGIPWAYITSPQAGWIVMEYVQMDYVPNTPAAPDTSTPAASENPPAQTTGGNEANVKGVITANGLNVREGASKNTKIVGNYSKGDVVTIVELKDGWGRTDKGWILMEYVKTNNTSNTTTNQTQETEKDNTSGNGSTTVQFKGIVTATQLNVRSDASTNSDTVGSLNYGARVEILEKNGKWGRTKDGWVSLDYIYQDGTTGVKTAKGIVTGDQLNIRSGPGTGYASVGSMNYGDRVVILEQFTYNGTTWGCTKDGWIAMTYVYVDGTETEDAKQGYITGDQLNIRSGPGTGYDPVGTLNSGDEVTIFFILEVGNKSWGNTDKGWISMDYVELY